MDLISSWIAVTVDVAFHLTAVVDGLIVTGAIILAVFAP